MLFSFISSVDLFIFSFIFLIFFFFFRFTLYLLLLLFIVIILSGCSNEAKVSTEHTASESSEWVAETLQLVEDDSTKIEDIEFHMVNALDSELELDIDNRHIMALEEVEVRGIPTISAAVNRIVTYQIVNVYAVIYGENYGEDDRWALIGFNCFDAAHDNIGWVKLSDLTEYTEENRELLYYPVYLSEDCKDIETGEQINWTKAAVEYTEDYAIISAEGGSTHKVKKECIVYPEYTKQK